MDWTNERYVRAYTRDTADYLVLGWQARGLWWEILRKADRSGVIATNHGPRGIAALVRWPLEVVEPALTELLADGCVQECDGGYVLPNYLPAQEAKQSDAVRAREYRERKREAAISGTAKPKTGWIYVCRAGSGEIKIGFAEDVDSRLRNLRTARPDGIDLVGRWPGSTADERELLGRFSHLRISGEWFKDDGSIVSMATSRSRAVIADARPVTRSSRAVTAESHEVTPSLAEPNLTDPIQEEERSASPPPLSLVSHVSPRATKAKAPSGPHQEAVVHFEELFRSASNGQRHDWRGKSGKLMADLVKEHGVTEVKRRTSLLFAGKGPAWLKPPFTIGTLSSQWNHLAIESQPTGRASTSGRFEPQPDRNLPTGDIAL